MFRLFFPPAGLASADQKLLLLLGAGYFVGNYDMSVLSLALLSDRIGLRRLQVLPSKVSFNSALGSHSAAISIICLSSSLAIPVVMSMLRETSRTELI